MASSTGSSFLAHFAPLRDPRQSWKVVYPVPERLLTVLSGTLAGAEDFVEIRRWAKLRLDFLRRFLPFASASPATACPRAASPRRSSARTATLPCARPSLSRVPISAARSTRCRCAARADGGPGAPCALIGGVQKMPGVGGGHGCRRTGRTG